MKSKLWWILLGWAVVGVLAMTVYASVGLTISDIVKLSKAGISDDVIIQTMQSSGSVFELTAQDIIGLKQSGVSDHVVMAMLTQQPAGSSPANASHRVNNAVPFASGPSGSEEVVRALPANPPVDYYQTPQPVPYDYYPDYYASVPYYYGPGVDFYFGYGGYWPYYYGGYWRGGHWGGYGHGWGHGFSGHSFGGHSFSGHSSGGHGGHR